MTVNYLADPTVPLPTGPCPMLTDLSGSTVTFNAGADGGAGGSGETVEIGRVRISPARALPFSFTGGDPLWAVVTHRKRPRS
jgi:hypothetical protein